MGRERAKRRVVFLAGEEDGVVWAGENVRAVVDLVEQRFFVVYDFLKVSRELGAGEWFFVGGGVGLAGFIGAGHRG